MGPHGRAASWALLQRGRAEWKARPEFLSLLKSVRTLAFFFNGSTES
jgi:hypothetical protein